jgi:hypothetical protein
MEALQALLERCIPGGDPLRRLSSSSTAWCVKTVIASGTIDDAITFPLRQIASHRLPLTDPTRQRTPSVTSHHIDCSICHRLIALTDLRRVRPLVCRIDICLPPSYDCIIAKRRTNGQTNGGEDVERCFLSSQPLWLWIVLRPFDAYRIRQYKKLQIWIPSIQHPSASISSYQSYADINQWCTLLIDDIALLVNPTAVRGGEFVERCVLSCRPPSWHWTVYPIDQSYLSHTIKEEATILNPINDPSLRIDTIVSIMIRRPQSINQ